MLRFKSRTPNSFSSLAIVLLTRDLDAPIRRAASVKPLASTTRAKVTMSFRFCMDVLVNRLKFYELHTLAT